MRIQFKSFLSLLKIEILWKASEYIETISVPTRNKCSISICQVSIGIIIIFPSMPLRRQWVPEESTSSVIHPPYCSLQLLQQISFKSHFWVSPRDSTIFLHTYYPLARNNLSPECLPTSLYRLGHWGFEWSYDFPQDTWWESSEAKDATQLLSEPYPMLSSPMWLFLFFNRMLERCVSDKIRVWKVSQRCMHTIKVRYFTILIQTIFVKLQAFWIRVIIMLNHLLIIMMNIFFSMYLFAYVAYL